MSKFSEYNESSVCEKKKRMARIMVVCTHGEVADFCRKYDMKVLETYDGDLSNYRGSCPVLVTNARMTREDYDVLKCELFSRGVDLVSTHWLDDDVVVRLIRKQLADRGRKGGRQIFGYTKRNGFVVEIPEKMAVARRVIEMRDAGYTLRQIRDDEDVYHTDGKKLAISTIQQIIKNRNKYEGK
jgi:hypothetical protein